MKPYFRNPGPRLRVKATRYDWLDGERFERDCLIEIQRVEMLNQPTGRYRRIWQARDGDSLGWQVTRTAPSAIRKAAPMPESEYRRLSHEAAALT